ncbi:hypothetical protein [Sphingomonas faeni]|uniref:hypothetical protein n=1 Tax=Sphingomonas faeni TaxID=185950 RepID=UPI002789F828|nr:hypothetical protein [Sphingomonas faeni]MDQ0836530.1 putative iron-regulated membrane protein [Sphingomonas faeni]
MFLDVIGGTLTALLVVLTVSGGVLWWRRRPTGLLSPRMPSARPRYRPAFVEAIVGLGIYMPLFGVTLLIMTIVERACSASLELDQTVRKLVIG